MITALYASLAALLIVRLSLNVIALRRKHQVRLGDGGIDELQAAIRTQGNATEYIPITLLLMLFLEMMDMPYWLLHLAGSAMLIGRVIHSRALKKDDINKRVLGMKITFYLIISLAVLNIIWVTLGYFSVWNSD